MKTILSFLSLGVLLVALMYFFLPKKPNKIDSLESIRSTNVQLINIAGLEQKVLEDADDNKKLRLRSLKENLRVASNREDSVQSLRNLSSTYFDLGSYILAGHYAYALADLTQEAEGYNIAATTFSYAWKNSKYNERERKYAVEKSREALENAISIRPEDIQARLNLAVSYTEIPESDNPMKGIQMLLTLNEQNPQNTSVLFQLGKFGIQTGQYDKAVKRLEKIVALEPNHRNAHCLLAKAYEALDQLDKMKVAQRACEQ